MLHKFFVVRETSDVISRETRFAIVLFGENAHDKMLLTRFLEYSASNPSLFIAKWSVPVIDFIEKISDSLYFSDFQEFFTKHLPTISADYALTYFDLPEGRVTANP